MSLRLLLVAALAARGAAQGPNRVMTDKTIFDATTCYFTASCDSDSKYGPIEEWDTSAVTNMKELFCNEMWCDYYNEGAKDFNNDISSWNVHTGWI